MAFSESSTARPHSKKSCELQNGISPSAKMPDSVRRPLSQCGEGLFFEKTRVPQETVPLLDGLPSSSDERRNARRFQATASPRTPKQWHIEMKAKEKTFMVLPLSQTDVRNLRRSDMRQTLTWQRLQLRQQHSYCRVCQIRCDPTIVVTITSLPTAKERHPCSGSCSVCSSILGTD